jgi:hypothetical protein
MFLGKAHISLSILDGPATFTGSDNEISPASPTLTFRTGSHFAPHTTGDLKEFSPGPRPRVRDLQIFVLCGIFLQRSPPIFHEFIALRKLIGLSVEGAERFAIRWVISPNTGLISSQPPTQPYQPLSLLAASRTAHSSQPVFPGTHRPRQRRSRLSSPLLELCCCCCCCCPFLDKRLMSSVVKERRVGE